MRAQILARQSQVTILITNHKFIGSLTTGHWPLTTDHYLK